MARHPVQGIPVLDRQGNIITSNSSGTVWSAKTGGSQLIDLIDNNRAGATDGFISTDSFGEVDFQYPNDGTDAAWVDFGFGRTLVQATDIHTRVGVLETNALPAFGTVPGGTPGPLDASGFLPLNQLPVGVLGGAATTDAGGDVPEVQMPLDVPYIIQYGQPTAGAWRTRVDRTGQTINTARTVIWKGPSDPTFNAGYALAGLDIWVQES